MGTVSFRCDLHEDAEILAKRELDEAERYGVRSDEVADVEDTGRPAELLTNKMLQSDTLNGVGVCKGNDSTYQVFSQSQDGAVCQTGFYGVLEIVVKIIIPYVLSRYCRP